MESVLYAQQLMNELDIRFNSPEFTHRAAYLGRLRDRVLRRRVGPRTGGVAVPQRWQEPSYLPW